jgi:superfamily II DNA or RNA helicase
VKNFWEVNWESISDDIQHRQRKFLHFPRLTLSAEQIKNYTLKEIQVLLMKQGKSLEEIEGILIPNKEIMKDIENSCICEEIMYDTEVLKRDHESMVKKLNPQQVKAYDAVINAVENNLGKLFFLYAYGGIGKTFVYRAIINKLRLE